MVRWPYAVVGSLALAGATASVQAASPTLYRVTNLGPDSVGVAINAKGQVAFTDGDPFADPTRAWFYDGARLHRIRPLVGNIGATAGVNDAGQVTGTLTIIKDSFHWYGHSFVWSREHGMVDIGTLPGRDNTFMPAINNRSEITGISDSTAVPPPHAIRWSARSGIEDLGLLVNGDYSDSYGRAINDAGMIAGDAFAGVSDEGLGIYHAFVWTRAAGMVDIDTLGNRSSSSVAIGANGLVAGNILNPPNNYGSIFWWTRGSGMHDLGAASGQGTWMSAMSSGGRIAGVITYPDFTQHAMTWTQGGGVRDLGTLGGQDSTANAANNRGQVVGRAATADGYGHAYVWSEKDGMRNLDRQLYHAPAGLELLNALAIADNGAIVASSNAGLVLLTPMRACTCSHVAGPIAAQEMVQLGAAVDTSIGFATEDSKARYNVAWSWGDGTAERARAASTSSGSGSAQARHAYSAPGIYKVAATISDQTGNSVEVERRIVVYEPSAGVVAGAGTVASRSAVRLHSPLAGGLAHFGFVAPPAAKSKATSARGVFQFALPGLSFGSSDVQASMAQGGRVQLSGTGRLNGASGYRFTATTEAASGNGVAGRLGVKIWHTDPKTQAEVVDYDSQTSAVNAAGHALVAGQIVVQ